MKIIMENKCVSKENNKRIVYYDILNVLAIIAVVALHCNGIVHNFSTNYKRAWMTSLIVECICYWAVPIFLMLSGATLMKYREKYNTKTFFKKRLLKVMIPLLFWAIIMIIWKYKIGQLKIQDFSVKTLLNIFFANKEEPTYYFMFWILGIYLTMPVLSVFANEKYRNVCWYTVATIFITHSILPIVLKLFKITYNTSLSIQLGQYLIFVLLGYLLSTQSIKKKYRIISYILGILSVLFRYFMTYYWTTSNNTLNKTLFGYAQFHSVLLACAVFIFIKQIDFKNLIKSDKIKRCISNIASCSFGIYLIHKIVMYYQIHIFSINVYSWEWRTIGIITTYIISLMIVYVVKKIPILKKIVP